MEDLKSLYVKLFADGADLEGMLEMNQKKFISGFTTNPTLMRKAGIDNYETFAKKVLDSITDKPVSFEVFSDDLDEMYSQAKIISSWAPNVYVKIPISNTLGDKTLKVVRRLSDDGLNLNITAIMTKKQLDELSLYLNPNSKSFVSIFAGRIADTGRDPVEYITHGVDLFRGKENVEIIWASPRELYNVVQADKSGCHIITATSEILNKLHGIGKDLSEFSLDTVKMFRNDAVMAGYSIGSDEEFK